VARRAARLPHLPPLPPPPPSPRLPRRAFTTADAPPPSPPRAVADGGGGGGGGGEGGNDAHATCWSCARRVSCVQLRCAVEEAGEPASAATAAAAAASTAAADGGGCGAVQGLDGACVAARYFELLGLPRRFDLPPGALEGALRRRQLLVHPDVAAGRGLSAREQEACARASATLNVAFRTLQRPAARAQYLLRLNGLDALGETAGRGAGGGKGGGDGGGGGGVSAELLFEVMEARELIADADARAADLQQLRARNRAAVAACERDLAAAFASGALALARDVTVALSYYAKIEDEVAERLDASASGGGGAGGGGGGGGGSAAPPPA